MTTAGFKADYSHLTNQQLIEVLEASQAGRIEMLGDHAYNALMIEAIERNVDPFSVDWSVRCPRS